MVSSHVFFGLYSSFCLTIGPRTVVGYIYAGRAYGIPMVHLGILMGWWVGGFLEMTCLDCFSIPRNVDTSIVFKNPPSSYIRIAYHVRSAVFGGRL